MLTSRWQYSVIQSVKVDTDIWTIIGGYTPWKDWYNKVYTNIKA
jgi:hypothetical protein